MIFEFLNCVDKITCVGHAIGGTVPPHAIRAGLEVVPKPVWQPL